jgi:hypothetical protein
MSSTNRGGTRADANFYPTAPHAVDRFLDRADQLDLPLWRARWLELGAGDGVIIRTVNAWCGRKAFECPHWTAIELRRECEPDLVATGAEVVIASVQQWAAPLIPSDAAPFAHAPEAPLFDVACFNPPFPEALAFVKIALRLAAVVVCLDRSPWIGDAEERFNFFRNLMPDEYRVGRIDFDGRGGDSIPYSWFVWSPGDRRRTRGTLQLLDPTPAEQRIPGNVPPPRQLQLLGGSR